MRWRWPAVTLAAALFTSSVFATLLRWSRDAFIGVWLGVAVLVIGAWVLSERWNPVVQLRRRWVSGLCVGLAIGALAGWLGTRGTPEPATARTSVAGFLWVVVISGAVDAMMLSVVPVLALYGTRPGEDAGRRSRLPRAGLALAASLAIAAAYHLGLAGFRGGWFAASLTASLAGNLVVTLAYLLSGSALAPIAAHIVMHGALVARGTPWPRY